MSEDLPVSEENMAWFHCGYCGLFFKSADTAREGRTCTGCGREPAPDPLESVEQLPRPASGQGSEASRAGHSGERAKRESKRHGKRLLIPKLVAGWILVLLAIVAATRWAFDSDETNRPDSAVNIQDSPNSIPSEDVELLGKAGPQCNKTFGDFLSNNTPEGRNQFVLDPINTAARMARFYGLNPLAKLDPRDLTSTGVALVRLPAGPAIETHWIAGDGRKLEAWFREGKGEWRLDWDHFVRYSDYPWALFLAGSGDPVGEFRLLGRERLVAERSGLSRISLVLYAPRFGFPENAGAQSPEFLIDRTSPDGILIDRAFILAKAGGRAFDAKLKAMDPQGMIPLRVRVRRIEETMARRFELEKVIACHWLSIDETGIGEDDQAPGK